jgi:hypothetical protein
MATYYWVGGTGDATLSTNWAAFSGGPGGAGVPTLADNIVIDSNSGSGTIDFGYTTCASLTVTSTTSIIAATSKHSIDISANCSIQKAGFCDYNLGQNVYITFTPSLTPRTMATVSSNTFSGVALVDADVTFPYIAPTVVWTVESVICFGASKLTINIYLYTAVLSCNDTTQLVFGNSGRVYFRQVFAVTNTGSVVVSSYTIAGIFFRPTDADLPQYLVFDGGGHSYPALYLSTTSISSTYPAGTSVFLVLVGNPTLYRLQMELGNKIDLGLELQSNMTVTDNIAFTQLAATTTYQQKLISAPAAVTRNITVNSATTFGTLSEPVAYRLYVKDMNVVNPARRIPAFTSNGCVDGGNNTNWDFGSSGFPILLN